MSQELTLNEKVKSLRTMLEQASPRFAAVAAKHLKVDRMVKLLLAAGMRTPAIYDCTQESVLAFCMKCSETGLEPIGAGGAWPIPYGKTLTFIPDYRGLVNCAKRGDCIKDAYAEVVREKDQFDYALGMEPRLVHVPARGDRGDLEAAYCIIVFTDDTKRFVVMDKSDVQAIKTRSKAASSGPWKTDEAEMWKKTVVRRAMKPFAGASPELDAAIAADDKAGMVIEVKEPIAAPKALKEEDNIDLTPSDTAQEPAKEATVNPEPTSQQDAPKSEPMPEGTLTVDAVIRNIREPRGKGPHKMETATEGVYDIWDNAIVEQARAFQESKDMVRIHFKDESNEQYTRLKVLKIERV